MTVPQCHCMCVCVCVCVCVAPYLMIEGVSGLCESCHDTEGGVTVRVGHLTEVCLGKRERWVKQGSYMCA